MKRCSWDSEGGYSSRLLRRLYERAGPFYDLLVRWGLLPLGGETACRRLFARWLDLAPGMRVASLCCGTGSQERALLAEAPGVRIVGVDLGARQLARARRKVPSPRTAWIRADAARTGLRGGTYDRVLICLALHEMWRPRRIAVLREARRICRPHGLVLVIEHGRPARPLSRVLRAAWWGFWIPGNPEVATSRDLQTSGLDAEMREAGLEVRGRRTTRPDWIEAFLASPAAAGASSKGRTWPQPAAKHFHAGPDSGFASAGLRKKNPGEAHVGGPPGTRPRHRPRPDRRH